MRVPVTASKRDVAKLPRVPVSHLLKKVLAVLVPVWHPVRCGAAAARFSRTPEKKITPRKLIARCIVLDSMTVEAPKTKLLAQKIKGMGLDGRLLIITDNLDENLYLSSRNLPNVLVLEANQADPVSLVRFPSVVVTRNAVAKIEEMFA